MTGSFISALAPFFSFPARLQRQATRREQGREACSQLHPCWARRPGRCIFQPHPFEPRRLGREHGVQVICFVLPPQSCAEGRGCLSSFCFFSFKPRGTFLKPRAEKVTHLVCLCFVCTCSCTPFLLGSICSGSCFSGSLPFKRPKGLSFVPCSQ